jgi:sRNA-binding carbon storage regulator CsrA
MAVNGSQVRIGINAPRDIAVDREEIAERKRRDREAAAPEPARNFPSKPAPSVTSKAARRERAGTPE